MIRAHLATFPPRRAILTETLRSIAPQVDRVFVCLNGYSEVPSELAEFANLEPLIPSSDLKDAGKFAFAADPADLVFTIDDDILYPPDYVTRTVERCNQIGMASNALGYQAHALVHRKQLGRIGWRNYLFRKEVRRVFKVDVLGTGTACLRGSNLPTLDEMVSSAGFVDFRFSRLLTGRGIDLWTLPRDDQYIADNLPDMLRESSLFQTVNRPGHPAARAELQKLVQGRTEGSGEPWHKLARTNAQGKPVQPERPKRN